MVEKRRFVRVDTQLLTRCRMNENNALAFEGLTKNISENGVRLVMSERIEVGAVLKLEINMPFDTLPIVAKGRVVWVGKKPESIRDEIELGIELIEVHAYHALRLHDFIDTQIRQQSAQELQLISA
jgi:hypothetical protein